jgi:hypothetical protein
VVEHVLGDTRSNFTSWTSDLDTAEAFATKGGTDGVVLTKTFPVNSLEQLPGNLQEIMGESEFLAPGPVSGASVTPVPFR